MPHSSITAAPPGRQRQGPGRLSRRLYQRRRGGAELEPAGRGRQPAGGGAVRGPRAPQPAMDAALHGSLPRQAGAARQDHHEPRAVPAPGRQRRLGHHPGDRAAGGGGLQPWHPPGADGQPAGRPRQHGADRQAAARPGVHLLLHCRFRRQRRPAGPLLWRAGPGAARADRAGPGRRPHRRARRRATAGRGRRNRPLARAGAGRHRSLRRRAAGGNRDPRLPAPRHRRPARAGQHRPAAQERPRPDLRRRFGLVRRGGRGILATGHRRAAGNRAAPPAATCRTTSASTVRPPSASTPTTR